MAIKNIKRWADGIATEGKFHTAFWHKSSTPISALTGRWSDLSMGAGIPKYNAYVGAQLEATVLTGSANNGIFLGQAPAAGLSKYINTFAILPNGNGFIHAINLCDYLMFYPLIEGDNTDLQEMDNTASLTRYTDGVGVRAMLVCTTPCVTDAIITISYTNHAGVSGRTSTFRFNAQSSYVGSIMSASNSSTTAGRNAPFIPLENGDLGIRSIQSALISTGAGGFFSIVLVKPLAHIQGFDASVATEKQMLLHNGLVPVKIEEGAYLNMICIQNNTVTGAPFRGYLEIVHQ